MAWILGGEASAPRGSGARMQGDGYSTGTGWHWLDVVWCLSIREQLATFDLGSGEVYGG